MNRLAIFLLVGTCCLVSVQPSFGTSPRRAAGEGTKYYQNQEYDKALAEFLAGLEAAPERTELRYDLGSALYKLEDYENAEKALGSVASQPSKLSADAWYNLGNTLLKGGTPDKAIEAYKNTLRLKHDDQDAKHNLEMALKYLQMQQQQQQQQQGEQDSTGNEKDQQQQPKPSDEEQEKQQQEQQQQQQQQDEESQEEQESQPQQLEEESDMSPEEALQLLQAMENEEQEAQKEKLLRQFGKPKRVEKDW